MKSKYYVRFSGDHYGGHAILNTDSLIAVFYRGTHGWKTPTGKYQHIHLAHQIYKDDLEILILEYGVREIVAWNMQTGERYTLWAMGDSEVTGIT